MPALLRCAVVCGAPQHKAEAAEATRKARETLESKPLGEETKRHRSDLPPLGIDAAELIREIREGND